MLLAACRVGFASTTNYVTTTNEFGPGSLREAIAAANMLPSSTILFSNLTGTIVISTALTVTANVHVKGPGPDKLTLHTHWSNFSPLLVSAQSTSSVSRLTFEPGGSLVNSGALAIEGCVFNGTSVQNSGRVGIKACFFRFASLYGGGVATLQRCVFSNSFRMLGVSRGAVEVTDSQFWATTSYFRDPAIACDSATLSLNRCSLEGFKRHGEDSSGNLGLPGETALGAAVYARTSVLSLANCVFAGNSVTGGLGSCFDLCRRATAGGDGLGGALYAEGCRVGITNCSFVGNEAAGNDAGAAPRFGAPGGIGAGGAVYVAGGQAALVNCTFSGNRVWGGSSSPGTLSFSGGGIAGFGGALCVQTASVMIVNSTLVANEARGGPSRQISPVPPWLSGAGFGGGIFAGATSEVRLLNCILYSNTGMLSSTSSVAIIVPSDGSGTFLSEGRNILDVTNGMSGLSMLDLIGLDPQLGPLQAMAVLVPRMLF